MAVTIDLSNEGWSNKEDHSSLLWPEETIVEATETLDFLWSSGKTRIKKGTREIYKGKLIWKDRHVIGKIDFPRDLAEKYWRPVEESR